MSDLSPEILAQIEGLVERTEYPAKAYVFVLLEICRLGDQRSLLQEEDRGYSASHLCWNLHDRAISEFGTNAREFLHDWNIHSTKDFGMIVFELVNAGLLEADDDDHEADFDSVFEFEYAFKENHFKTKFSDIFRWRISTMFAITTLVAIAFAGFSIGGYRDAMGTIYSTWFMIIGGFTLYTGVTDRSKDWLLAVLVGAIFFGLGFVGFVICAG